MRISYAETHHVYNIPILKVLLLEGINPVATNVFENTGYEVTKISNALNEDELVDQIQDYHVLGIRSKTHVTKRVLDSASNLLCIGCFCIGTDQVDVKYASEKGIIVFNSPFSNSRSVAELVLAEVIALARHIGDRNIEMHNGIWNKTAKDCCEVRGKTLGIVGYGHIGSQLSVLAEAIGMFVIYYDVQIIMPHGLARSVEALSDLLAASDFISLHVPDTPETRMMIGKQQFEMMKKGAFLINASRGTIVDIDALKNALEKGHIRGAALDVYPAEPGSNGSFSPDYKIISELAKRRNVILTPHIGGSTEEAQRCIGLEVSTCIIKYVHSGCTIGAVLFPEVDVRAILKENECRILNVHTNVPGVLVKLNNILSKFNIDRQTSNSNNGIAYVITDVASLDWVEEADMIINKISKEIPVSISTRLLYRSKGLKN